MSKKLLRNLLLTFILSLLLTGLLFAVWFGSKQGSSEEGKTMTILFAVGDIFQNTVLTIASLPSLLLAKEKFFKNVQARLVFYFAGPVLLTIIFVFVSNSYEDKIVFLLPGLSFFAIHSYFYFRLMQFKRSNTG